MKSRRNIPFSFRQLVREIASDPDAMYAIGVFIVFLILLVVAIVRLLGWLFQ